MVISKCRYSISGNRLLINILKARALTEAGKPDQAISLLNGAITETKESRLYTERAEANILKGDYSGAIAILMKQIR